MLDVFELEMRCGEMAFFQETGFLKQFQFEKRYEHFKGSFRSLETMAKFDIIVTVFCKSIRPATTYV